MDHSLQLGMWTGGKVIKSKLSGFLAGIFLTPLKPTQVGIPILEIPGALIFVLAIAAWPVANPGNR